MKRAAAALLGLAACAHAPLPPPHPAGAGTSPAPHEPLAGKAKDPANLLGRGADEGEVLLRLSVARHHALGPRLEPFVLAWPGWGATLRRICEHPLAELDWVDVVGPKPPERQRLAARAIVDDASIDARLRATGDGTMRVASRPAPHLVTVVPPGAPGAAGGVITAADTAEPEGDAELGLRADVPRPHRYVAVVPESAERAQLWVRAMPGDGAEARLDLVFPGATAAAEGADELRATAARLDNAMVALVTHDLFHALTIELDGATVHVRLPADREQLEAVATLAAPMFGLRPSTDSEVPSTRPAGPTP